MSEFSESFHLFTDDPADGVALLERAGVAGWVFPPAQGWCMVVVDREFRGEPDPALVAANRQLLLFYMNAEDHGWGFTAYDGTDMVSSYTVEWTDDIEADLDGLDLDALRRHLPELPAETWSAIEADLHPPDDDTAIMTWAFEATGNPGHRTAERLGLTRARWMSGAYLTHDAPDGLDPGVIRVERP